MSSDPPEQATPLHKTTARGDACPPKRALSAFKRLLSPRNLALLLFAVVPFGLWLGSAALEIAIHRSELPDNLLDDLNGTPIFFDKDGEVIAQIATDEARVHIPVALGRMGEHLPAMTVALEDHRFPNHRGVDLYAVCAALYRTANHPGHLSGASTVSQQTIKLADKRKGRRLRSKVRESVLALKLERAWDKDEILESYINRLDYGNRRLGPEAAAWAYFGKPASALGLAESIYLAGLPQSPTQHNPWLRPSNALAKYRRSLARLEILGLITAEQATRLAASPPVIRKDLPPNSAPAFVDALRRGGFQPPTTASANNRHHTTLDAELQARAETILRSQLAAVNRHDVRNAGMVVIENATGAVRALASVASGDGLSEGAFNATLVPRHAGSTLKPFVYLLAIDSRKLTAASLLPDTPDAVGRVFPGYEPQNYNRRFAGPVRVRYALANSLNVPAVLTLHTAGARKAYSLLTDWGLRTRDKLEDLGAGFVLGNRKVRLLDLAAAYAGLARGGLAAPPSLTNAIATPPRRLASTRATGIIADILADDRARSASFGRRSALDLPGHRAAVKTGTSSSHRDAWTVGFDRDHTVAVWVGNLNGRVMTGSLTIDSAAPAWRRMMLYLADRRESLPLPQSGLDAVTIDSLAGLIPCTDTKATVRELFLPGTEPEKNAEDFYTADGTPQLPEPYALWCASEHNHLGAIPQPTPDAAPRILQPRDGSRFVLDPDLPLAQQHIALLADSDSVVWEANGSRLDSAFFPLKAGTWEITARAESGAISRATITIEP